MRQVSLSTALEDYTSARVVGGNRIEVLLNGEQIFPAMLEAIGSARRTITFAQYFYGQGPIARDLARALAERCRAGIGVKVLLDSFGSRNISSEYVEQMQLSGCHVVFFRPLGRLLTANYRNHRRILVIDGRLGFTGGAGVGRKWMGNGRVEDHWRDTDVRVDGPVVEHLQRAFAESWLEATGMALDGPAYYPQPYEARGEVSAHVVRSAPVAGQFAIYSMFLLAVSSAQRSVYITNPYFLPGSALTDALIQAVSRGVRVAVLAPGPIDYNLVRRLSRANFGRLLREGVEIYEYKPALLHAKTMIIDGVWATVGSANL
ncbi:MAG TPA: phospholipase D-like domain-containing protein, partial [Gemmatimonadales bacterium]|nr:phospholipase D-like domain-containing protein [Gemmatimonadales bacterium]